MKRFSFLILLPVIILMMCCRPAVESQGSEELPNENGVICQVSDSFEIKLEGCPTCGYRWYLDPFDSSALQLQRKETIPLNRNPGTVGGYAHEIWTFTGLRSGEFVLNFRYKRPWLEEVDKTEQVRVKIRD